MQPARLFNSPLVGGIALNRSEPDSRLWTIRRISGREASDMDGEAGDVNKQEASESAAPNPLRTVALSEFFLRLALARRLDRRRLLGIFGRRFLLRFRRGLFRLCPGFWRLLRNFDIDHLQIRERVSEDG